jgi:hypothetical protein
MPGERLKRLILELDSEAEPIEGRMRTEGGASRKFVGWLGLAAALRGVLGDPGSAPEDVAEGNGVARPGEGG